ncbi:hypothetical protein SBC1_28730 [Caballeronia sp. SBC1]|nr:hypothetical protein SBC1_28730 [Caballeronia sp. SBC1]
MNAEAKKLWLPVVIIYRTACQRCHVAGDRVGSSQLFP